MGGDTISLPDSSIDDEDLSTINQQFRDCSSQGEPNRAKIFDAHHNPLCSDPISVSLLSISSLGKLQVLSINGLPPSPPSHCQLCITTIAASFRLRPTLSIFPWFSITSDAEGVASSLGAYDVLKSLLGKALQAVLRVTKNKKRIAAIVPGLRSNKKVSGLVDKWKAVKVELHKDEEDEEPENALEALENKKQREIEQIATKEAKDNANFQPLGGDWRERVRRKRAKKQWKLKNIKERDLVQLTKQLPSRWQKWGKETLDSQLQCYKQVTLHHHMEFPVLEPPSHPLPEMTVS
ncbi:hypothetical protein L2E82_44237 [Cichorium intybus]|uniref:Uncharacterized protein n=1 Tax=Cichorium intybus TaxID=13427 RepID=A0ACB8ZQZ8_CICIN|nr:hypothetical protein L2E82_44237 [Cichorium intybus]